MARPPMTVTISVWLKFAGVPPWTEAANCSAACCRASAREALAPTVQVVGNDGLAAVAARTGVLRTDSETVRMRAASCFAAMSPPPDLSTRRGDGWRPHELIPG